MRDSVVQVIFFCYHASCVSLRMAALSVCLSADQSISLDSEELSPQLLDELL